ncbi:Fic family protein [Methylobacterium sp. P31]
MALGDDVRRPRAGLRWSGGLQPDPGRAPGVCRTLPGSPYPALRRCLVASAFSATQGTPLLIPPDQVAEYMVSYARLIAHVLTTARDPSPRGIELLASATIVSGKIHPFLDGNGHIQRLTFQVPAERAGYRTSSDWRIHPKPYGEAMDRVKASGDVAALASALAAYLEPG